MNNQPPGGGANPHWSHATPPFNQHAMPPHQGSPVPVFHPQSGMPYNVPFQQFTNAHPIQPPPGFPIPPPPPPGLFPPSGEQGASTVSNVITLENRLRGLILGNAEKDRQNEQVFTSQAGPGNPPVQDLPPHMRLAPPQAQQSYLEKSRQWQLNQAEAAVSSQMSVPQIGGSPQHHHRHPNQQPQRQNNTQFHVSETPYQGSNHRGRPYGRGRSQGQTRGAHSYVGFNRQVGATGASPYQQPEPMGWRQNAPPSVANQAFANNHGHPRRGSTQGSQGFGERPPPRNRQLYEPSHSPREHTKPRQPRMVGSRFPPTPEEVEKQAEYLQQLADDEVPKAGIDPKELQEKDAFREMLERICIEAIADYEKQQSDNHAFDSSNVALKCFGSIGSGFATQSSDMDLALLSPESVPNPSSAESGIPRALEKRLLDLGIGARLLERTRVPIIKLCENPTEDLLRMLRDERRKWEEQKDKPIAEEDQTATQNAEDRENPASQMHKAGTSTKPSQSENTPRDPETELNNLEQLPRETLRQYYRRTKRLMESIGGRDYTLPQHKPLENKEGNILNRAGAAYLAGLEQDDLKLRLQNNPSMVFDSNIYRSLFGVWTQAEAESLVIQWEKRRVSETTEVKEDLGQEWVREWKKLQCEDAGEILLFNKRATVLWENLKTLPSISLTTLSQLSNEESSDYCSRAVNLLKELGGRGLDDNSNAQSVLSDRERQVFDETVLRYMDGIRGDSEKMHVREFFATRSSPSLAELQLQHATENELYLYDARVHSSPHSEEEVTAVEEYTKLVRQFGASDPNISASKEKVITLLGPASKRHDRLEFPKSGVGIQCDINFSNRLALHNTTLLRCYSHCDPRVRPMVLFIKTWAKRRQINTPYHGTLSSYGYVLMILHYLANIAQPPVVPNLQLAWKSPSHGSWGSSLETETSVDGYDVRFWRAEDEIKRLADKGMLTHNKQPLGLLLREFFAYYAHTGADIPGHGFTWGTDVLSLRTPGGLLTKQDKGWTGARTVTTDDASGHTKEVRCRYLFAIEDPFEIDHNIARTVTHNGIVGIRDEFRRAWTIMSHVGKGSVPDKELLEELDAKNERKR
ncbi:hypothetical protein L228DRAFT_269587 [Xylona heveae TC161]|uniref:polynucleotide adenylyltransferase n=1 Tax=Xylona heveae (strain CBS 132557 / TC161) TaxID=1328760 RepID=A0A165FNJ3_XYLHT|nr:hypothetical protein L228DRAFT_269587 [Xylona heveae TC161]KZF21192.1 hypothetical protein L228DRAFT_269587 [Xylona heveae TC161]